MHVLLLSMKTLKKDTHISLLMGGPGLEREVSLVSGRAVLEALQQEGFTHVSPIIVDSLNPPIPAGTELCYNLIHGTYGEDGGLQEYLEKLHVPYTGADSVTSRLCFDKILTKEVFVKAGVRTPRSEVIELPGRPTLPLPVVVKPPCEGSSVGVEIARTQEELDAAIQRSARFGSRMLAEEFINGKELTVAILDGVALPVIHICPRSGFYDFKNKYPTMYGGAGSDYICPADLTDDQAEAVQQEALRAYRAAGVEVYGRVDLLLPENGKPYVLEINTIPGMTSSSLFPKAAKAVGMSYGELCVRIAEISLNCARTPA